MSNKQTPGKNPNRPQGQTQRGTGAGAPTKPMPGRAQASGNGATTKPVARPGSNTQSTNGAAKRAAMTPTGRPAGGSTQVRKPVAKKSGGFKIRPMDLGLILIGLLIVAFIVFNALQTPAPTVTGTIDPNNKAPAVGDVAPDFNLPDTTNANYQLSSFKGKVVLVEFMATWCPHCQDDAPMFNAIYDKYQGKDVQLLAINATPYNHNRENDAAAGKQPGPATMEDLKWFKDTYKAQYPILFDKDLSVTNKYGIQGYPTLYIVGKDGKITSIPEYPFSQDDVANATDQALK